MKYLKIIFITAIRCYQLLLSPLLRNNCRFVPSCSNYMIIAIKQFGVIKGLKLGFLRIKKCHPWGKFGYDPVPKNGTQ